MKPDKEQVIQEIKDVLKKYDAEISIEMKGREWLETPYIALTFSTADFDYEEVDLGKYIIP